MGKKRKPLPLPTLEEQLRTHDATEPAGIETTRRSNAGRLAWACRRIELTDAIRKREGKRLADTRRDVNFGVSPYAGRGHVVENAPQELRSSKDSGFPKRIATQRMIDRYRVRKLITTEQWRGGDALWQAWVASGNVARMTASYDPDAIRSSGSPGARVASLMEAAEWYVFVLSLVPRLSRGCVTQVVIIDSSASDWARLRGYAGREAEKHGLDRLRPGLSALADYFGY